MAERVRLSLSLLFKMPLVFLDYSDLFLCCGSDNIRQIIILAISELTMLAGVQSLLDAEERTASDYFVGSLCLNHVNGGMFPLLLTTLPNILSHLRFYKRAERMCIDPVLIAFAFPRVTEVYCSWYGGSESFVS